MNTAVVLTKEEQALHLIEIAAVNVIRRRHETTPPLTDVEIEQRRVKIKGNVALQKRLKSIRFERIFLPFLEIIEFVGLLQVYLGDKKEICEDEFAKWETVEDCFLCIARVV